jgi:hypothetical protein
MVLGIYVMMYIIHNIAHSRSIKFVEYINFFIIKLLFLGDLRKSFLYVI